MGRGKPKGRNERETPPPPQEPKKRRVHGENQAGSGFYFRRYKAGVFPIFLQQLALRNIVLRDVFLAGGFAFAWYVHVDLLITIFYLSTTGSYGTRFQSIDSTSLRAKRKNLVCQLVLIFLGPHERT